ncbi:hypothetical protein NDK47_21215 [Brevibacillus ruminantium]|uniref:Uncharacterized protein n=1 Tax=Brevibacillus ruminantium TaxID=2950604 RepID=A0ABY4WC52_9BACL|nr:hypothetical protein [Brevibacillus ruminantium]USG64638.1 hypothetical protein NDK47_21215 [Brevibacillus ruminantium]
MRGNVSRIHKHYIARIVLDLSGRMMAPFTIPENKSKWFIETVNEDNSTPSIIDVEIDQENTFKLMLPYLSEKGVLGAIEKYTTFISNNLWLPDGGLAFIDTDTGEFIPTHWDVGEIEEWRNVLQDLSKTGESLHTFSSTEAVVELKKSNNDVVLQSLDWGIGLDESRISSTVHIFKDIQRFIQEVKKCLEWQEDLFSRVNNHEHRDVRDRLLQNLSVEHR